MASGRRDLIINCECGAGICTVGPLIYNEQCLFICCPKGLANGGGCGFMQWRDPNKTTTWHSHDNLPPPPPLFTTTVAMAEYTPFSVAEEDTPPPHMTTSQDAPPPPPPPMTAFQDVPHSPPPPPPPPPQTAAMMCPYDVSPCSIGIAKNGRTFYSCSSCKFIKWCDAGSSSQCYICREEGHWYMDCPQLPPSNNKNMICFYCKQEGHYVSQCPSKSRRRRRN